MDQGTDTKVDDPANPGVRQPDARSVHVPTVASNICALAMSKAAATTTLRIARTVAGRALSRLISDDTEVVRPRANDQSIKQGDGIWWAIRKIVRPTIEYEFQPS